MNDQTKPKMHVAVDPASDYSVGAWVQYYVRHDGVIVIHDSGLLPAKKEAKR